MVKIHAMAITNPTNENMKWYFGAFDVVVIPKSNAFAAPNITVTCQT